MLGDEDMATAKTEAAIGSQGSSLSHNPLQNAFPNLNPFWIEIFL